MHEKRQYVRMSTVFPVEIEIHAPSGEKRSSQLLQGFTRDLSEGGVCIELKSFGIRTEELLAIPGALLSLTINPSFSVHPVKAAAKIAWVRKEEGVSPAFYRIGAAYIEIDAASRKRLIGHAQWMRRMPRLWAGAGIVLLAALGGLFLHEQKLIYDNRVLVRRLVDDAQRKSEVSSAIVDLERKKSELEEMLVESREKIRNLERAGESSQRELATLLLDRKNLQAQLKGLQEGREKLESAYHRIAAGTAPDEAAGLAQMTGWIQSHQNLRTGLVASFEGDAGLDDWAFTYDQSLACQVFMLAGDKARAESILSFYDSRASTAEGAYFNAYNTLDGQPVENTVHTGPNLWIGIAALQHSSRSGDGRFLPMARRIADWVMDLQDAEGGVKGGPEFSWYSTEHNLDAYAFFNGLYEITREEKYRDARDRVLGWIKKYAYSQRGGRMNRGKGDATISTDTFSWAVAALGPAVLETMDFDPDAIMDFAEKNCAVKVPLPRAGGGTVEASGFDFAKAEHVGRGGILSTEWTAQMIVAYQILAAHYRTLGDAQKSDGYRAKADFYLNELQKLIITSPSRTGQGRGCLPYASIENVDTGHGWRTPKGQRTGSVAGTSYGIFAWKRYNPFALSLKKENS